MKVPLKINETGWFLILNPNLSTSEELQNKDYNISGYSIAKLSTSYNQPFIGIDVTKEILNLPSDITEFLSDFKGNGFYKNSIFKYNEKTIAHLQNLVDERSRAKYFEEIDSFKTLKYNWDGYNAEPTADAAIHLAKEVVTELISNRIKIDICVPMRDGGIQFDIDGDKYSTEIEIHPDQTISLIVYNENAEIVKNKIISLSEIKTIKQYI